MDNYRELLLGCGHSREKRLGIPGQSLEWKGLVTLDHNPACQPQLMGDLNEVPWAVESFPVKEGQYFPWPITKSSIDGTLSDNFWDEVHAYEVLEHLGSQGDADSFFAHFSEIWRVLKPGGHLFATVPSRYSPWLWGDPSHRRAILPETLVFLDQTQYTKQCDGPVKTPMSDFRNIYKADFDVIASTDNHVSHIFCLQAVKPSRISQ